MKGSPVTNAGVGNASLLNATVDAIDMIWSCIAMWRVKDAHAIDRGQVGVNGFTQGWNKGRT
jgi:hypothetical protein